MKFVIVDSSAYKLFKGVLKIHKRVNKTGIHYTMLGHYHW